MLAHHKRFPNDPPPALARKPTTNKFIEFYLSAFHRLNSSRSAGFSGPSPISFSDICNYAQLVGYTNATDIFFFADVIMECDSVYMNISNKSNNTGD